MESLNKYIILFLETYTRTDIVVKSPIWHLKIRVILHLAFASGIIITIVVLLFSWKYPDEKFLISSVIYPDDLSCTSFICLTQLVLGGLLLIWIQLSFWSCVAAHAAFFITYIYSTIFILGELKYKTILHTT